jgi:hypothetical protein
MLLIVCLMIVIVIVAAAQYHKGQREDKEIFKKYCENRRGIKYTRRNNRTTHTSKHRGGFS